MKERQLQTKVCNYLQTVDGLWYWKTNDRFTRGIPDIIGCYCGFLFGIELKVGTNKMSMMQRKILKLIRASGGFATCAYDMSRVKVFIEQIKYEKGGESNESKHDGA